MAILHRYETDDDNKTDSESFQLKAKFTNNTNNDDTVDVETAKPLKYPGNFWRTLGIPLINCKMNLMLTWSTTFVLSFEENKGRTGHTKYFLSKVEINDYYVITDGRNIFEQSVINNINI